MNHDEMIEIIQAHKEGKEVQREAVSPAGHVSWVDDPEPSFNFNMYYYRIKPEAVEPERLEYWVAGRGNANFSYASKYKTGAFDTLLREVLPGDLTKEEVKKGLDTCWDRGYIQTCHAKEIYNLFGVYEDD